MRRLVVLFVSEDKPRHPTIKPGAAGGEGAGKRFDDDMRDRMLEEDPSQTCVFCGCEGAGHLDHAIPRSPDGNNSQENCQWACEHCNCSKGNRDFPVTLPADYEGPVPPPWWPPGAPPPRLR